MMSALASYANFVCTVAHLKVHIIIGNSEEAFEVEAREERKHRVADASENIYIKGIGAETTEDQVREVVARFGSVVSIDVSNERGFAFIGYETVDEAAAAVASQPLDIDGASVTIEFRLHRPSRRRGGKGKNVRKRAERRRQARDPNSVYLKGVPVECDEAMIQGALAQFGTCVTVSHRARSNYAFAAFDSPEAMDAAIAGGVCSLGGKDVIIEIRNTGSE